MGRRFIMTLALTCTALCTGAASAGQAPQVKFQFGFFHFKNERVRMSVDGKTALDRVMTVSRDNERYGLAAFVYIDLPTCADIIITTKRQRIAQRFCRTSKIKSVVVDGGPPLTMTALDYYQGLD